MTQQKTSFPQRFYRRAHEADKASEEISAAGVENTRSFSAAEFHEPGEWQFKALISLDYTSCRQKARLLLYLCAGTEIAQPPSCRKRLNLGANEACAVVMVPNISKKSTAVFKDWRMQL
ncbi:MAG TPA: hypothetical protein VI260_07915 [Blastocatellia bacterium]|jgi:hypothetical protein